MLKKVTCIYYNEGGHTKYIRILSYFFRKTRFVVHVRLFDDAQKERLLGMDSANIEIISISKAIHLTVPLKNYLIYDGFRFNEYLSFRNYDIKTFKLGIVGRVTETKGFNGFLEFYFIYGNIANVEYHFYGDIDVNLANTDNFKKIRGKSNLYFHGFEYDKIKLYDSMDILVHFNENEGLGRIFFESLDYGVPFIGINSAGIGEIAEIIKYPYVYSKHEFFTSISKFILKEDFFDQETLISSRQKAVEFFSIDNYTTKIDKILI